MLMLPQRTVLEQRQSARKSSLSACQYQLGIINHLITLFANTLTAQKRANVFALIGYYDVVAAVRTGENHPLPVASELMSLI